MILRLLTFLFLLAAPLRAEPVVIFAASSLKPALDTILDGEDVAVSYGGSGVLARQILAGAPADIFLSANPVWSEHAAPMFDGVPVDLVSNHLVIVGSVEAQDPFASQGKIATGLLRSVPLGIYAKAYLQAEDLWDTVSGRIIETDSAQGAVALFERGEVPCAMIYASDLIGRNFHVVYRFKPRDDLPIRYPAALIKEASPAARALFSKITSKDALTVFQEFGFSAP